MIMIDEFDTSGKERRRVPELIACCTRLAGLSGIICGMVVEDTVYKF